MSFYTGPVLTSPSDFSRAALRELQRPDHFEQHSVPASKKDVAPSQAVKVGLNTSPSALSAAQICELH
jgi:hypothetical protein